MNYPDRLAVPSGAVLTLCDLQLLQKANEAGSIVYREKPFTLKSGIQSNVYVFFRGDLTDSPNLLNMVAQKIVYTIKENMIPNDHQPNLIGLPTAGTALAVAVSMASVEMHKWDTSIPLIASRVMREKLKKEHGANDRWVNGDIPDLKKFTFWTIDNVVTDGGTKFEQAKYLEQDGYPSKDMPQLIFVDRQQGAIPRLQAAGLKRIVVCYNLLDITFVYSEFKLWPKETVKRVEEEIKAHQFL
ncbi:MAG: hypothetical protein ABIJ19_01795 [Patescibacteria group bacterium]